MGFFVRVGVCVIAYKYLCASGGTGQHPNMKNRIGVSPQTEEWGVAVTGNSKV